MRLDFSPVVPVYDLLNDVMSFGLHRLWKRRLVRELRLEAGPLAPGVVWMDVASGTGDVVRLLSKRGNEKIVAIEPCAQMMAKGLGRTGDQVTWLLAPAEALPVANGTINGVTCSFGIRNFDDRVKAFSEWKRVMKAGGVCAVLEMHPPPAGLLRTALRWHWSLVIPLVGRLVGLGGEYRYLRDSVESFVSPGGLAEEAKRAGLIPLRSISLFGKGMVSLSLFRNYG